VTENTEQKNMARIDDYIQAKNLAIERLRKHSFQNLVGQSGFKAAADSVFEVPMLDRIYTVGYPSFEFQDISGKKAEIPIQEQVLILHYLDGVGTAQPSGNWVTYREIPEASFYFPVFIKRAVNPLKNVFGQNLTGFSTAARKLNAAEISHGDSAFEFHIFPKVPIQIILWEGDEEFPAEANMLFDESIARILSPEDIAWLSGMLAYRLIAIAGA